MQQRVLNDGDAFAPLLLDEVELLHDVALLGLDARQLIEHCGLREVVSETESSTAWSGTAGSLVNIHAAVIRAE